MQQYIIKNKYPEYSIMTISSVQSLNCVQLCALMDCSMPGFPVHYQLPKLAQTHVHWASDAIQPSHPLSSPSPPAFNLSQHQGLFQEVSSSHQLPKSWSFSFSISPSSEYSGLISCRMDQLDLLSVQRTLKSLLQHHSSKIQTYFLSKWNCSWRNICSQSELWRDVR